MSSVNVSHDGSRHVPEVPVETEGSPDNFTSSEAILGLKLNSASDGTSFADGMVILPVVKMPAQ